MIEIKSLSALILAGGKGTRMAKNTDTCDKALLIYKDKSFIQHIMQVFTQCKKIYISINKNQNYRFENATILIDDYKEIGPLAGLYKGLLESEDPLWVSPCDTPFLTLNFVECVAQYANEQYDAFIV
ncbi:MAG: molybdenum cofactor guanylyltransferase, partial [Treponemataceae bacterium]